VPRKQVLSFSVNGRPQELLVRPNATLLEVLREDLELTGAKEGCGEGACGSCTVLVDGRPRRACLTLALEMDGRAVTTIEGLAQGGRLHPVQQAFVDHGAIQCGFCAPGMILVATAFLEDHPDPTEAQVRAALSGNVCRCTGYAKIVEAVLAAAGEMKGREKG
jgi:carbon-monoxide dehydrogenase small subunit